MTSVSAFALVALAALLPLLGPYRLALAATSDMGTISAWHMDTMYTLTSEMLDPIVSPNALSGHMHRILGKSTPSFVCF